MASCQVIVSQSLVLHAVLTIKGTGYLLKGKNLDGKQGLLQAFTRVLEEGHVILCRSKGFRKGDGLDFQKQGEGIFKVASLTKDVAF